MAFNGDGKKGPKQPKKLVLFFDGTGNKFCGNGSDTNIVKLHNMMDRATDGQYHYYQPGIGTYVPGSHGPMNPGLIGQRMRKISQGLDQGFGSSFDAHVIAGYQFLMRHYKPNAFIYIFGFSRGAFTARFLASLISHVGLLSMGNEELIPFAYEQYLAAGKKTTRPKTDNEAKTEMDVFRETFCRPEVIIKFLGLFDSVSSIALFDFPGTGIMTLPDDLPIAENIRHAVALDEGRTKFKPALLGTPSQKEELEKQLRGRQLPKGSRTPDEILKEVWFAGNHGDIGGGWEPYYWYIDGTQSIREGDEVPVFEAVNGSPGRFRPTGKTRKVPRASGDTRPESRYYEEPHYGPEFQLSDIALEWMLKEMDDCLKYPDPEEGPADPSHSQFDERLAFVAAKEQFLSKMGMLKYREQALTSFRHNCLAWNGGPKKTKVLFWWLLEILPGLKHIELEGNEWVFRRTPNLGSKRDIGKGAILHKTVKDVQFSGKPQNVCERYYQTGWGSALTNSKMGEPGGPFPVPPEPPLQPVRNNPWWKRALYILPLVIAVTVKPIMTLFAREAAYSRLD